MRIDVTYDRFERKMVTTFPFIKFYDFFSSQFLFSDYIQIIIIYVL